MKKLLSLVVVAVMVFAAFSASVQISAEGSDGSNISISLNYITGTLTISGTGDMKDYPLRCVYDEYDPSIIYERYNNAPWANYCNLIKTVEITSGVRALKKWNSELFTTVTILRQSLSRILWQK